jgi:uncharacterized protein YjbJ (UPF0337 family)
MSLLDKANNKLQWLTGEVKELAGRATGNKSRQAKGERDQGKADLKDAGEKVKDGFKQ